MTFRKFDTCTWTDPWFENLSPAEKLAFIYFWTNDHCNSAGIYVISANRIENDIGHSVNMVVPPLKPKIEWFPECSVIWVRNFFKHQCQNVSFAIAAMNCVKKDIFKLRLFMEYNESILSGFEKEDKSSKFNEVLAQCRHHVTTM